MVRYVNARNTSSHQQLGKCRTVQYVNVRSTSSHQTTQQPTWPKDSYQLKHSTKLPNVGKIFEKGFCFTTLDLKNGYHHIKIHNSHTGYLGFAWDFQGQTKYLQFLVMPFGLSSASYIFTKMLRSLVNKWRDLKLRCMCGLLDSQFTP